MGKIVRALSEDGGVLCSAINSTDMVQEMARLHCASPVVTAALGRMTTAVSIMGGMLKYEGDTLTLRINGGGPCGTLTAVADQNRGRGKRSGILKSLFPSAGALEKRYPYLKKYPFLLPVAWGARIVHYGSEIRSSRNNTAAGAVKIGTRRVELLKQYGILDR